MSWLSIKTKNGLWKLKPRWEMRWAERARKVKVVNLGLLVVTWWSNADLRNEDY